MITGTVSVLVISFLAQILKKWVRPKWGRFGIQVSVFVLAVLATIVSNLIQSNPLFAEWFGNGITLLAASIASYEILLKKILPVV